MGTTTAAIQLVKHLQLKGYQACYIEVNATGFVKKQLEYFAGTDEDASIGRVTYENVDMYHKQEFLQEVLRQNYDFFVFDYGAYSERGFNKTSFLEKDIRIFVAGSKAQEMQYTNEIMKNEYYTDVYYLFNFISEKEKPDIVEYMETKKEHTFFTVYTPDQFEYVQNKEFERLIPVEDVSPDAGKKKRSFWGIGKEKGIRHGKKDERNLETGFAAAAREEFLEKEAEQKRLHESITLQIRKPWSLKKTIHSSLP